MRKRMILFLLLALVSGGVFLSATQEKKVWLQCGDDNRISVKLTAGLVEKTVYSWEKEGTQYFFLPAFADRKLYIDSKEICVDGQKYRKGQRLEWQDNTVYQINSYDIVFMKSENIPAIFINTDSGGMEIIEEREGGGVG